MRWSLWQLPCLHPSPCRLSRKPAARPAVEVTPLSLHCGYPHPSLCLISVRPDTCIRQLFHRQCSVTNHPSDCHVREQSFTLTLTGPQATGLVDPGGLSRASLLPPWICWAGLQAAGWGQVGATGVPLFWDQKLLGACSHGNGRSTGSKPTPSISEASACVAHQYPTGPGASPATPSVQRPEWTLFAGKELHCP